MKYTFAPEIQKKAEEISILLFPHIKIEHVKCFKSQGSSTKRTIARCHAMGKIMQKALDRKTSFYVLEFLSERFDKLSEEDKIKTIIHELMHIPKSFGGGFKHHNHVTEKNVKKMYNYYLACKKLNLEPETSKEVNA